MATWECILSGRTTGYNGKPRRINARINGAGDVKGAIYRYMARRRNSWEWFGVELRAITPLGQSVLVIYEPNEMAPQEMEWYQRGKNITGGDL